MSPCPLPQQGSLSACHRCILLQHTQHGVQSKRLRGSVVKVPGFARAVRLAAAVAAGSGGPSGLGAVYQPGDSVPRRLYWSLVAAAAEYQASEESLLPAAVEPSYLGEGGMSTEKNGPHMHMRR